MSIPEMLRDLGDAIERLKNERDEAEAERDRLARINGDLLDELAELRAQRAS